MVLILQYYNNKINIIFKILIDKQFNKAETFIFLILIDNLINIYILVKMKIKKNL